MPQRVSCALATATATVQLVRAFAVIRILAGIALTCPGAWSIQVTVVLVLATRRQGRAFARVELQAKIAKSPSAPTVVDVDVDLAFGVGNFSWSNSYTVDSKEYRFFRAEVDDSLYDVTIYARSLSGDAHVYIGYDAVGLDTDLPNSATKIWESSKSGQSQEIVHLCGSAGTFLATWTLQPTAAPQISAFPLEMQISLSACSASSSKRQLNSKSLSFAAGAPK